MNDVPDKRDASDTRKDIGKGLRAMVLELTPDKVEARPSGVFGVVMDWDLGNALATLVAMADGGTSLYLPQGGFLGGHAHPKIREAGQAFLTVAERFVDQFPATTDFPTPKPKHARFYVLTTGGVHGSPEVETNDLRSGQPGISELFGAAQEVITQIRVAQPKQ